MLTATRPTASRTSSAEAAVVDSRLEPSLPGLAPHTAHASISPARRLQRGLEGSLQVDQAAERWSPRATLLFILATCGGFWALAALALRSALHY